MALNSTVFKVDLHVANMDTNYYHQHQLTLAKHPSETEERLMVRILAFALYAHEALIVGKGVSDEEEPALSIKNMSGEYELWIELGLPDERRIRKACGRAKQVVIVSYGKRNAAELWWKDNSEALTKKTNLTVIQLAGEATQEMAQLAALNMQLNCLIESGHVSLVGEAATVAIEPVVILRSK